MVASSSTSGKKARAFPKLMKDKGYTVLFDREGEGTVVHKGKLTIGKVYTVCEYRSDWNMAPFEDTDDIITLCSKEK